MMGRRGRYGSFAGFSQSIRTPSHFGHVHVQSRSARRVFFPPPAAFGQFCQPPLPPSLSLLLNSFHFPAPQHTLRILLLVRLSSTTRTFTSAPKISGGAMVPTFNRLFVWQSPTSAVKWKLAPSSRARFPTQISLPSSPPALLEMVKPRPVPGPYFSCRRGIACENGAKIINCSFPSEYPIPESATVKSQRGDQLVPSLFYLKPSSATLALVREFNGCSP